MKSLSVIIAIVVVLMSCSKDKDKRRKFSDHQNTIYDTYNEGDIFYLHSDTDTIKFTLNYKRTLEHKYTLFPGNYFRQLDFETDTDEYLSIIMDCANQSEEVEFEFTGVFIPTSVYVITERFKGPLKPIDFIYSNTYVNNGYYCFAENNNNDTLFWVDNIGIVKVSLENGNVYELIK